MFVPPRAEESCGLDARKRLPAPTEFCCIRKLRRHSNTSHQFDEQLSASRSTEDIVNCGWSHGMDPGGQLAVFCH